MKKYVSIKEIIVIQYIWLFTFIESTIPLIHTTIVPIPIYESPPEILNLQYEEYEIAQLYNLYWSPTCILQF